MKEFDLVQTVHYLNNAIWGSERVTWPRFEPATSTCLVTNFVVCITVLLYVTPCSLVEICAVYLLILWVYNLT
jgi:hypothetical protein